MHSGPPRDYVTEVRALIDVEMKPGDIPPVIAARIVEKLRATDPELLAGYLDAHAVDTIRYDIHAILSSARGRARTVSRMGAFQDRVINGGDPAGWLSDAVTYPIDKTGAQMPLRLMTGEQVLYAADTRTSQGKALLTEAAFLRALAKRVPAGQTVGDVFDEQQITELRQSITGTAA